jgi:hypothetical protein
MTPKYSWWVPGAVIAAVGIAVLLAWTLGMRNAGDVMKTSRASSTSTSTPTVWSEPWSYCDEHEHRVYVGPTDGAVAPSIAVVPYEPSCDRRER